jgi:thymidylate synthase ThyX
MFMQQGEGMTSSPLPVDNQQVCAAIWQNVWDYCAQAAQNLSDLGVSNEFSNRVFPTYKMMHGVITATEDGWRYLRRLRQSKQADWTMQIAATIISEALAGVEWAYRSTHLPYITDYERSTIQGQELFLLSGARCARVSYARQGKGKTDKELYTYLLDPSDPHLAPFEHAAIWTADPPVSPLNCVPADRMSLGGWYPFRYVYSSANGETVFQPK